MNNNKDTIFPLLAKVGHKLNGDKHQQAQELWEHFYDEDIKQYEMNRLTTIQDIFDISNPIDDIVMVKEIRKYSTDYDYKRVVIDNNQTIPHKNMNDLVRYRGVVNNLRDKKKIRATPERVSFYQSRAKQNVRMRGTTQDDTIRHFLRALTQEVKPFKNHGTYIDIVNKLKYFGVNINMLKNAKRKPFVQNIISNDSSSRALIRKLLKILGYETTDKYQAFLDLLIHKGLSNPYSMYDS